MIISDILLSNRTELISDLALDPNSDDPAIVLAAWQRYGAGCADRLYGDFAFALVDPTTGVVFAARDHVGSRPLFYRTVTGQVQFASTLRALVRGGEQYCTSALDDRYVLTDLSDGQFVSSNRTALRAIRKLAPGHWLVAENGKIVVERYWYPERLEPVFLPTREHYVAEGKRLLRQAVECRIPSKGRIGTHLSGGLDSSAIATILRASLLRSNRQPPLAYAWSRFGPEDEKGSDGRLIDAMTEATGLQLRIVEQDSASIARMLRETGPADPDLSTLMIEDAVQRAAVADGVGTIFSGWGGDEGLSYNGRGHAADLLLSARWVELAHGFGGGLRGFLRGARSAWSQYTKSKRRTEPAGFASAHLRRSSRPLIRPPINCSSLRDMQLALIANGHLASRMEDWAQAGAERGLVYRFPLLDRKLLEFALSIPGDMFHHAGQRRWLFREICREILPESVRTFTSKKERRRVNEFRTMLDEAYRSLAGDVASNAAECGSRLIDMERLQTALRHDSPTQQEKPNALRAAVRYLDLS